MDQQYTAGSHLVTWQPRNVASGTYFYRLRAGENVVTKRMTLLE